MSIEARTAFDRLIAEGDAQPAVVPVVPVDTEDERVIRQNREAVAAWSSL